MIDTPPRDMHPATLCGAAGFNGDYGSGRFRLPLPTLPASRQGPDNSRGDHQVDHDFVPFQHAPRHQQPLALSRDFTIPQTRSSTSYESDPFQRSGSSLVQYSPPLQSHALQQHLDLGSASPDVRDPFLQSQLPYQRANVPLPRNAHVEQSQAHYRMGSGAFNMQDGDRSYALFPFQHTLSRSLQSDQNRAPRPSMLTSGRPLMVTEDVFSSPAAQAARRQQTNRQPTQNIPPIVPVSLASSPNSIPTQHGVSSPDLNPRLTASNASGPSRLALIHAPPFANGIRLISPREKIPDKFQPVFPYQVFNAVQSKCFESVYNTNDNVVVSAPTGSGKTALLELAICKLITQKNTENAKIVYIAPTKALCKEKAEQWRQKFTMLSISVSELTGDTSRAEMRTVREAKIIVTTPEKWDSVTRSWADHRKLLDLVELFLIDEVHILKESRGATLEAVVSRMKTYGAKVRFVALSATVPNSSDIAAWLGRDHASPGVPAHREVFGEQFRPVKLQKLVHGIESKMADHPFDKYLNSQLWKYIEMHTQKKPMLVFCMTRKSCRDAAEELAKQWSQRQPHARLWPEPKKRIAVIDANLQEVVRYGVAFHHAGLELDDRKAVHEAFEQGHLHVICCTSTLAVGINLPCHTVVLKGTVCYQDGGQLSEYSDLEVMQMLGRAGRPQYEDSALAIILTRSQNTKRYEDLESGQQILESTLQKNLIEHVNSEISLGTFRDTKGAKTWLRSTFLSVRLQQNPQYYGDLTDGKPVSREGGADNIENKLEIICEAAIDNLRGIGLVSGDRTFQHTAYGRAMSKYMIRFETMKKILEIPRASKTRALLIALCEASEFKDIRWQANEREMFRDINKDPFIMYPVEGNVATIPHKVSLLIQSELSRVEPSKVNGFERQRLRGEALRVLEVMHRLIRAVVECKGSDSDGPGCWAALELARSLSAKAWEGRPMQLLQVPQVGPVLMRKFVAHNIRTVHQLVNSDPGNIERIASRNPPFGKKLKDSIALFPMLTLAAAIKDCKVERDGKPVVHVDALLGFSSARGKWLGKVPIVTFLAVTSEGFSAHFSRDSLNSFRQDAHNSLQIQFSWTPSTASETLMCRFACEEIVGTVVSAELHHSFPASAFRHLSNKIQPSTNGPQRAALDQTTADSPNFENEIDDADIDGLLDDLSHPVSNTYKEIESEVEDIDLFALIDRDGNLEMKPPKSARDTSSTMTGADEGMLSDIDDVDLFAMLDRDGSLETKQTGSALALQKSQTKGVSGQRHKSSASSVAPLRATQQHAGTDTKPLRHMQEKTESTTLREGNSVEEIPVRLPNGRYKCGHPCSQFQGGTTARGDRCGHDCCRNGSKHPPKKNVNGGKRKAQHGGSSIPESEPVPDFSLSNPLRKRARATDASKPKAVSSTSKFVAQTTESRFAPVKPQMDFDLYEIDEEGLIDLTQVDEPTDSSARYLGARSTQGAVRGSMKQGRATKRGSSADADDLLDDFSETDLTEFAFVMEEEHDRQSHLATRKRSNNSLAAFSDDKTSLSMAGAARSKTAHNRVGEQARPIQPATKLRRTSKPLLSSHTPPAPKQPSQTGMDDSSAMQQQVPEWVNVEDSPLQATKQEKEAEPRWVQDFDEDFISELRGLVDFI